MNIIESEVWKGSGLTILGEKGSGGCGKSLNKHCVPMDEDNWGWRKGRGWGGNLVEGGEQWRGGMRNICNNMNNKDLF